LKAGITLGEAADLQGETIPAALRGINPAQQIAAAKGRGGQSDLSGRATVFLTMMESSLGPMEVMLDKIAENGGLDRMTDAIARTNPKSFWGNLFTSELLGIVDDEERAVITYMRNFVANWQYFASGAQINEGEYSRLVDAFFPRSTDGPLAQQAKEAMRNSAIEAISAMALGQWTKSPVEPLINSLSAMQQQAIDQGWSTEMLKIISEKLGKTQQLQRDLLNPNKTVVLGAPSLLDASGNEMGIDVGGQDLESIMDAWAARGGGN